jgi:hypothetical protein
MSFGFEYFRRFEIAKSHSVIEKYWLDDMEFDEALTYAIDDFKENYENYIAAWKKL